MEDKKLKLSGDILTFTAAFILLVVAFVAAGLYWWAIFWVSAALLLGFIEYLAWKYSGKTLSEQLGNTMRERPAIGWFLWGLIACGFIALLLHFIALAK